MNDITLNDVLTLGIAVRPLHALVLVADGREEQERRPAAVVGDTVEEMPQGIPTSRHFNIFSRIQERYRTVWNVAVERG